MVWTCLFLKFSFLETTQRHIPCFRQEYISIEATASHLAIQESKHVPVQQVFFSSISSSAYRLRFAFSLSSCSASCCIIRLSPALVLADAADWMIADCSASAPGRVSSVQSVITRRIHQHRTENTNAERRPAFGCGRQSFFWGGNPAGRDMGMEFGDVDWVRIPFAINSNPFPTHSD